MTERSVDTEGDLRGDLQGTHGGSIGRTVGRGGLAPSECGALMSERDPLDKQRIVCYATSDPDAVKDAQTRPRLARTRRESRSNRPTPGQSTAAGLVAGPWRKWPNLQCCYPDGPHGICQSEAAFIRPGPTLSSAPWLYCHQHRLEGDQLLPADLPYSVTRITLEVVVARAAVHPASAADEAVRHVVIALDGMGAIVTAATVQGGRASVVTPAEAGLRLTLGGPALPVVESRSAPVRAPAAAAGQYRGPRR